MLLRRRMRSNIKRTTFRWRNLHFSTQDLYDWVMGLVIDNAEESA